MCRCDSSAWADSGVIFRYKPQHAESGSHTRCTPERSTVRVYRTKQMRYSPACAPREARCGPITQIETERFTLGDQREKSFRPPPSQPEHCSATFHLLSKEKRRCKLRPTSKMEPPPDTQPTTQFMRHFSFERQLSQNNGKVSMHTHEAEATCK